MYFTIAKLINGSVARGAPLTTLGALAGSHRLDWQCWGWGQWSTSAVGAAEGCRDGERSRDTQGQPQAHTACRQLLKVIQA